MEQVGSAGPTKERGVYFKGEGVDRAASSQAVSGGEDGDLVPTSQDARPGRRGG